MHTLEQLAMNVLDKHLKEAVRLHVIMQTCIQDEGGAAPAARSAAARWGQWCSRSWHAVLIEALTAHLLAGQPGISRQSVQHWQRETFGQALSARWCTGFCRAGGPGHPGQALQITPLQSRVATRVFRQYRDACRARFAEGRPV